MITFYRPAQSEFCDEVEETLREWTVTFQVKATNGRPQIADSLDQGEGESGIKAYLDRLRLELRQGLVFQSDTCSVDPANGKTC